VPEYTVGQAAELLGVSAWHPARWSWPRWSPPTSSSRSPKT